MRADIDFKNYTDSDYEALCSFLIALNENNDSHINWNWARLEWMIEHPEFDKSLKNSIYEPYKGFADLKSLQVMGTAEMVEPFSEEYRMLLKHKSIPEDVMRKLPSPMNLIKIIPDSFDYLDSDLKKDGYGNRQHLDV